MTRYIDKDTLLLEIDRQQIGYNVDGKHSVEYDITRKIIDIINTLEVKEIPSWKKTMHDNGCWSCEIGVNPSKRLYEYEHYTINADELFKLLDKEE